MAGGVGLSYLNGNKHVPVLTVRTGTLVGPRVFRRLSNGRTGAWTPRVGARATTFRLEAA